MLCQATSEQDMLDLPSQPHCLIMCVGCQCRFTHCTNTLEVYRNTYVAIFCRNINTYKTVGLQAEVSFQIQGHLFYSWQYRRAALVHWIIDNVDSCLQNDKAIDDITLSKFKNILYKYHRFILQYIHSLQSSIISNAARNSAAVNSTFATLQYYMFSFSFTCLLSTFFLQWLSSNGRLPVIAGLIQK